VNTKLFCRRFIIDSALAVLIALYTAGAFLLSRHASYYDIYKLSGSDSVSFEKARVLSVDSEQLEPHPHQRGLVTGTQNLTVKILTGTEAGHVLSVVNYLNYDTNFKLHADSRIIVSVNKTASGRTIHVYVNSPESDRRTLFRAGMHMGRDMTGTMASTLILAFAGTSLVPLIQIYTYNMRMNQVLNANDITVELIQSLTGSLAVICAVPIVSAVSALLLCERKGKHSG